MVMNLSSLHALLGALGKFRWAFPFVMLGVGYLIPALRVPVGWPQTSTLWALLFFSLVAVVVWLVSEVLTIVYRYTSSRELQGDDVISLAVALVITYLAGWQRGGIEWWIVLPWLGAAIDAFFAGYLAINNAAQKPFFPEKDRPTFTRPSS
ncbi:hypothetical protein HYW60_02885 [Candidatus Kaiserbacteria bacterium]|nr:hypothetical protein [Candidatus Kaiserbacteria bacterium]